MEKSETRCTGSYYYTLECLANLDPDSDNLQKNLLYYVYVKKTLS